MEQKKILLLTKIKAKSKCKVIISIIQPKLFVYEVL